MGNNKSHYVVMVPLKRTREEWIEYISISPVICSRAGVASIYLFPNQITFASELVNQNARILQRRSVYTHTTNYTICCIGHNPVSCNICYIANYVTFFLLYHMLHRKKISQL